MDFLNFDQDRSLQNGEDAEAFRFVAPSPPQFQSPEPLIPQANRIPLVVVHPNSIVRFGIHHAWASSPFIHVCGVAPRWSQLQLNSAAANAKIGLFGLPVSGEADVESCFAELKAIVSDNPDIKWIVIANQHPASYRKASLAAGACGYTEGDFTADRLESMVLWVDAGRKVGFEEPPAPKELQCMVSIVEDADAIASQNTAAGKTTEDQAAIPSDVVCHVTDRVPNDSSVVHSLDKAHQTDSLLQMLSNREREVLEGLAVGKTNQQIADTLFLSVKTIETYRSRLKQKLGLKDRAEMVAYLHGAS